MCVWEGGGITSSPNRPHNMTLFRKSIISHQEKKGEKMRSRRFSRPAHLPAKPAASKKVEGKEEKKLKLVVDLV